MLKAIGKMPRWKKVMLASAAFLLIAGTGASVYAGYLYHKAQDAIKNISAGVPAGTAPAPAKDSSTAVEKPLTVLLTAIDNREGSDGSMNTDVMMLVSLNPSTHAATIVSIPRDLEIKPPKKYNLSDHKANYYYAYYYGKDKETAIPRTKELFSDLFQIPIDYMAVINFEGFRQLVDELDGVEVNVDMDMRYTDTSDGTDINLKKGLQTLSGKQTLDFLRYRKSNGGTDESSDTARNERQQMVLSKLVEKLTSFSGITQWGGVMEIAGRNLKTDIPENKLRDWVLSFRSMKPDTYEFIPLNAEWESPYMVVKEKDMIDAMNALETRLLEPGEAPGPAVERRYADTMGVSSDTTAKDNRESAAAAGSSNDQKDSGKSVGSATVQQSTYKKSK
ncbi:LCP family protein [Paenibacillus filicis]|uniref:LCP family protein n=1 Tax=Paenibacillus gyeongsangnamensis TaxID=3388067 RepID=A0ABT4Q547_9BACL|nr:LCP family protein [Paenibacillus filicis]MCZ8512004.1 LCP family protein [Paenibacillus filicis]